MNTQVSTSRPEDIDDTLAFSGDDWDDAPISRRRTTSRLTVALVMASVIGLAFVGGALAQKHLGDEGGSGAPGQAGGFAALFGGQLPAGGAAGGQGGFPGGGAQGGFPGGARGGTQGGFGAVFGAGGSATIGQVKAIKGRTLYVETRTGTTVAVNVPAGLEVSTTVPKPLLDSVNPGSSVVVQGERGPSGAVVASSVTVTPSANAGAGGGR